ncbi:MAG: hypothetical protein RBT60_13975 [Candidatus Krumholzibacteria bacterium]|jgi:phenylacetate-CoA ligase|nr:hypothetical protein [Candidatus Krumholzibacteria bacterium]
MPVWNHVYETLPIPAQNLALSFAGWWIQRRRFGRAFNAGLRSAEARLELPVDVLCARRDERIRSYVAHCEKTVPYWRRRFRELGIDSRDVAGLSDLPILPVINKEIVRDNLREFYSEAWSAARCWSRGTGGTTGASLRFYATPAAVREQWAVWWRNWRRLGISQDTWCAYFVGLDVVPRRQHAPPFWRTNRPRRQIAFSVFHLRPDTLPLYVAELRRRQLPWLHGYPSVLALVARYILETGDRIGYCPRWITTGAENLMPHQDAHIKRAFGVAPRQHYGLAEGVANLSGCSAGNLHVDEDFAAVEFVPSAVGDSHRLIGTNLSNPAFCLLRYDTGDLATLSPSSTCACGRSGRFCSTIDGRKEDTLVLADGTRLGRLAHVFEQVDSIREAQFVQTRPGAVILNLVPRTGFAPSDEAAVLAAARRRLGATTEIDIRYVSSIPREPNGKLRFVRSELSVSEVTELDHGV